MASASEHAVIVLSAIIPQRKDLLEKALMHLTPSHFPERVQQMMFTFLERYAEKTAQVMPDYYLDDLLRGKESGQIQLYTESYALYAERTVTDSDFIWSVSQLRELAAEKATGEVITEAMEILKNGKTDKTGETLKGHLEARTHILEAFSAIDRDLTMQESPEGDLKDETADILEEYAIQKAAMERGTTGGVFFGIHELDKVTGGMHKGELILAAGYSSDGKTTLCTQAAWSAAVEQGKNVVFLTTETLRPQVRRKIISRHSKLPIFGLPAGLNTRDIKAGTLKPADELKYVEVVNDLTKNPAYGRIYIAQVPRSSTMTSIEQRLYRIQQMFNIDLVVMDYLALMVSDRARQTTREELAAIIKDAKVLSTTFNDGIGVPFMSPWQVSRAARENAEKAGEYSSASLSETAEATNSADLIVSLLAPTDNNSRYAEVAMQVLKARDGETASGILVDVDYATSHFASKAGGGFAPAATTPSFGGTPTGGLEDLIS
jgi:replicative DNA helicase